ncbi:hypothetical protein ACN27F_13875 [Solwaraspora sp. WMMB335]|uniref:hypothetical protein n=1 Tax=Solwaraspora sp. WMMB335 TaxID=3404118 RepID=UPI003B963DA5
MTRPSRPNCDNPEPSWQRPPRVATDDLERALRHCLVRRAADQPFAGDQLIAGDLAGQAIRRARRIRRARVGTAAVAAVCTLAVGGLAGSYLLPVPVPAPAVLAEMPALSTSPTTTVTNPDPPAAPRPVSGELRRQPLAAVQQPPVDLVVANELRTADGQLLDLTPIERVSTASRVADGWLVVGDQPMGGTGVWYVTTRTAPQAIRVLPAVDAIAVDPASTRIAWRSGAEVGVATVVGGRLSGEQRASAPEQGRPVGFVGDAVLMARDGGGDRVQGYGVWWPSRGAVEPVWNEATSAVYGPMPDGRTVVGQVSDATGRSCLALLDVLRDLFVEKTACTLPLTSDGRGAVSRDGRWLMANGAADVRATSEAQLAVLVDLASVFDVESAAVREAGPRLAGTTVWIDEGTVVHAAGAGEIVEVDVDRISNGLGGAIRRTEVTAPTGPGAELVLVDGVPDRR